MHVDTFPSSIRPSRWSIPKAIPDHNIDLPLPAHQELLLKRRDRMVFLPSCIEMVVVVAAAVGKVATDSVQEI